MRCVARIGTDFGALAVGMDDDRALVHSLHEPVRQLLFQSGVKFNLRSVGHFFQSISSII